MRKLREVLRLRFDAGLSARAIAQSCRLSVSTVSGYLGRIAVAKVVWPLPPALDDDAALTRLLFPTEGQPVRTRPEPDWPAIHRELRRPHVTKLLVWQEYREREPDGYQYSQFCARYATWAHHCQRCYWAPVLSRVTSVPRGHTRGHHRGLLRTSGRSSLSRSPPRSRIMAGSCRRSSTPSRCSRCACSSRSAARSSRTKVHAGPNCVIVESAPHTIVMRDAALLVTHGGHGTVMRGLVNRVPMLVLPHGRDQNDNAVRITERGAGLSLMPDASVARDPRHMRSPAPRAAVPRRGEAARRPRRG